MSASDILIISNDHLVQNAVAQVALVWGYTSVIAESLPAADDVLRQRGANAFRLVLLDANVMGEWESHSQVCTLYDHWRTHCPDIPWVFLGTVVQKYPLIEALRVTVPFVTLPLRLHTFAEVVRPLLPEELSGGGGSPVPPGMPWRSA